MADIITLLCPVDAAPGRGAALREALKTLAAATAAEPGNLCYKPHATGDPDRFIIYEQWRDRAALDRHMATAHLQKFLADEAGLLAGEPHGQPLDPL